MLDVLEKPALKRSAHRISVPRYHAMIAAGILGNGDRVELLDGVLVDKMPKSELHVYLTEKLADWLRSALPKDYRIREEKPLTLAGSEPEPDIAVVEGPIEKYRDRHPTTAVLVVEISVSSREAEEEKADIYAAAMVAQYLIVDGNTKNAVLFTEPSAGAYNKRTESNVAIDIAIGGERYALPVADLLALPQ